MFGKVSFFRTNMPHLRVHFRPRSRVPNLLPNFGMQNLTNMMPTECNGVRACVQSRCVPTVSTGVESSICKWIGAQTVPRAYMCR